MGGGEGRKEKKILIHPKSVRQTIENARNKKFIHENPTEYHNLIMTRNSYKC
jgi:hypothetical protein